jgi:hypothetical protein
MQDNQPGIYQAMFELDLHGGDQTGMWMLNYDFPYAGVANIQTARAMADAALYAFNADKPLVKTAITDYLALRQQLFTNITDAGQRYYDHLFDMGALFEMALIQD